MLIEAAVSRLVRTTMLVFAALKIRHSVAASQNDEVERTNEWLGVLRIYYNTLSIVLKNIPGM